MPRRKAALQIRNRTPLPIPSNLRPALNNESNFYPTPRTQSLCGGTGSWDRVQSLRRGGHLTEEEARAMTSTHGQLNPDWVEWLMGWPVGWTDIERDLCDWRDLSVEPEDISIATTRRDNRPARIKAIGNGQVPLCAAVAAESGFAFLESLFRANPGAK